MTGNKTEKKRISSKIFVALAALTLVSCCFLGTTFARYTTGTMSGDAGIDIADWDIVIENINSSGVEEGSFAVLSPAQEERTDTDRTHELPGSGAVVRVTNYGQVSAKVTFVMSEGGLKQNGVYYYVKNYEVDAEGDLVLVDGRPQYDVVALEAGVTYHDKQGRAYQWDVDTMAPAFLSGGVHTVPDYWASVQDGTDSSLKGLAAIIQVGDLEVPGATETDNGYEVTLTTDSSISLNLTSAIWTSDFDSDTTKGKWGDLRDTWIGENIDSVGYSFEWSAVQASERP